MIFAQMVDDPASRPELFATVEDQDRERERLFRLIEDLVKWENTTNEVVLQAARDDDRDSAEVRREGSGEPGGAGGFGTGVQRVARGAGAGPGRALLRAMDAVGSNVFAKAAGDYVLSGPSYRPCSRRWRYRKPRNWSRRPIAKGPRAKPRHSS